jgi:hypothetical protein
MEPKNDEVGVRLDKGLQERVNAYASREGLISGEAISALLYLGLEFAERQRTGIKEDFEDLQREVREANHNRNLRGEERIDVFHETRRRSIRTLPPLSPPEQGDPFVPTHIEGIAVDDLDRAAVRVARVGVQDGPPAPRITVALEPPGHHEAEDRVVLLGRRALGAVVRRQSSWSQPLDPTAKGPVLQV